LLSDITLRRRVIYARSLPAALPISEETYAGTLLTFDWHYNDLVNEKAGIAKVNALIFDTPDGVYFSIEITTEDAKKIAYRGHLEDRKSTRLNSSHVKISYAVFCLKR